MCIIDQRLNELMQVVIGVRRGGRYWLLYADAEVQKAIRRCYEVGASVAQVKNAVESAYIAEVE